MVAGIISHFSANCGHPERSGPLTAQMLTAQRKYRRCDGLRVSEVLALKWNDLDFIDHLIQLRRAYVDRRFGPPKSKASKAPVTMHPVLAAHRLPGVRKRSIQETKTRFFQSSPEREETTRSEHAGRGLPESSGEEGRSRHATAYLRFSHLPKNAGLGVGEDESRCQDGAGDPAAPNLKTTLESYAMSMSEDRLLAQGMFLELLFSHKKPELPDGVVLRQ